MAIVGLIPAAGRGLRMLPYPCPKELFPVGTQDYVVDGRIEQRPKVVSQFVVEAMVAAGATRIMIIIGERKFDVMRYYGDGSRFGVEIAFLYQQDLRGMPFALDLAWPWLDAQDTAIFGMPDTIVEPTLVFRDLLQSHRAEGADVSLGLFRTRTPWKFGMVELDGRSRVVRNHDKPKETTLDYMWGIGCWNHRFATLMRQHLRHWDSPREIVLSDLLDEALRQGLDVLGVPFDSGSYHDIGS
jgi:glucose-1-phosphate thymidylyltransferase